MARHGENIRKRKDGRWEGRYSVYIEEKGRKVYRSLYGASYEEVRVQLLRQKGLLKEEMVPDKPLEENGQSQNVMFVDIAEQWLKHISYKNKVSTCVKYTLIYRKYLEPILGKYYVTEISGPLKNQNFMENLSESTQKSIYCVINQILYFASKQYKVSVQSIKRQGSKGKHKPIEVLTRNEQAKLFSVLYCDMDIYKMAVVLCLYTGLRIGEICALKWADLDLENNVLYIERTVQRVAVEGRQNKTELLEATPKSEYSRREIPVSIHVKKLFMRFQSNGRYVFGGSKPMEPRTLQYRFKKQLEEAGLPNKNFHVLRHTFATNCIEGGTDVKSLSEILGHSDVQITLNRYVHPSMDSKRKQLEELSKIYGQIYGQTSKTETEYQ